MRHIVLKYKLLLLGIIGLPFVGCNPESLTDLNIDPNNPVAVPAVNLVTQAEYQLNNLLWGRGLNFEWSMLMVQHFAQSEYAEDSRYTVDATSFNFPWTTTYAGVLNELAVARKLVEEDENVVGDRKANQLAIIDVLTVYAYHNLTDLYGAIPFSQALNSAEFPLPKYDSQQQIYTNLLSTLSNAVSSIKESSASFDSGDLIFNGDMSKWRKFGNSLLMRMALRAVDADGSMANQYITQAASGGMLTSNADNALFVFSDEPALSNPFYIDAILNNRDDFAVTDVLVDDLKARNDPRLEKFAKPTNAGTIEGMPYGLTDAEAFELSPVTSRPNDAIRSATAPAIMLDYAEVEFMRAEAIARGILTGDAAAAYAAGIAASMEYWGISDQAAIDDYVRNNPYDANDWKASIGAQKWIAFYTNGVQAWAEWRRLDQPVLAVPAAATNPAIPVRLPYPIDEETRNGSSLQEVTSDPNDLNTKMWWDVN